MSAMQFYRRVFILLLISLGYLFLYVHYGKSTCDPDHVVREEGAMNAATDARFNQPSLPLRKSQFQFAKEPTKPPEVNAFLGGAGKAEIKAPTAKVVNVQEDSESPKVAKQYVYDVDKLKPEDLLSPDLVPNYVFYVWCGRKWFEFHHYLSVLSVVKELKPDNLIFYYDNYPVQDYWLYNTWFQEVIDLYPFFILKELLPSDNGCVSHGLANTSFIYRELSLHGGLYISEHSILADYPAELRKRHLVDGLEINSTGLRGLLKLPRGLLGQSTLQDYTYQNPQVKVKQVSCASITAYIAARDKPYCINTGNTFFPKDIWELNNDFGRLVRRLFYGGPDIRNPVQDFTSLIPNIAHIVWIGGGQMDYLFYLCVLSLIYVAQVDTVYIHGDGPPSGPLWWKVKDLPQVKLIYRESPATVYGTSVNVISHITDIWRVDFMIRYGGIYVDTDTIFARPLDRNIRAYDAVGSYDWTYWNDPFPDTINFGVAIGKRNADYWHRFQESMKWFIDKDWSWNGLRQPYRIKERHPELVLIDPHLQVICYEFKCHPTWWPNYHNESIHHLNTPSIKDWKNEAFAYHFTLPTPPEFLNEENLLKADSMFGEIGKQVLKKAGLLNS